MRISKDSQVRKLISFVMGRLERGGTVTLQALNQCVHKAITVALISRDRLGNIFQVNSLLVVQEGLPASADNSKVGGDESTARVRTTSGIQIILSKSPLDDNEVGYEKPMPKGFVQQVRQKRYQDRRQRNDEIKAAEQKASAERAAAEKASTGKRRPASRRRADKAEKEASEVKEAPISAKAQRRRQSRSKPEKQPEK